MSNHRLDQRWSPEQVEYWLGEKRNWSRWGDDDQVGAVNLIGERKRADAAKLVQNGISVSLSYPMLTDPTHEDLHAHLHALKVDEGNRVAWDYFLMPLHQTRTHIDALNHVWGSDGLYNARTPAEAFQNNRAVWCDIDVWKDGIVTRGVVFDVPKHRGTGYVPFDEPVTGRELADIALAEGLEVKPGDALIIRAGRDQYVEKHGTYYTWGSGDEDSGPSQIDVSNPGLDITCLEFFRTTDSAVIVWDMVDCQPHSEPGLTLSVHSGLWAYGLALVDNCSLDELAETCARLNRYECMLMVSPLRLPGSTASPVNPIALL
jgi:kynurenine formamidase